MSRIVTLAGYVGIVAAAVLLELTARRRGAGRFGDALTLAMRRTPVRLAVLAAWLWLGWHLLVRVNWR
jgi:hypothetical protein